MRKFKFIALIAVLLFVVGVSVVFAKNFITGYDVNNNYMPVQVETGVYYPGISLYPYSNGNSCSCNIGGTTNEAIVTTKSLTQGGGVKATSTTGSADTLLYSNFDTENMIDYTANVSSVTLTLPASSTLKNFIPTVGQTRTIYIRNATTSANINLTISGGTGTLLKKATSSATIYGDTDGANFGRIDFIRKANTDIEALLSIFAD